MSEQQRVAHLVGSIPLENTEIVLETVANKLGPFLKRIPDGETGKRIGWIRFLQNYLNNEHPDMETDTETPPLQWRQWDGLLLREVPMAKFKEGVNPKEVTFDTGYASSAISSYEIFSRFQSDGVIDKNTKFQVCIPTPFAPGYNFVSPPAQDDFLPIYTQHLINEIDKLTSIIPCEKLAIQWDVCQEVLMWEGYYDYERPDYKQEICSILGKIGDAVPNETELGYHLCYGSPKDEHLVQPTDTSNMVEMTHGIISSVSRSIQFFHLPIPKNREDDDFFKPLGKLQIPEDTELYLGLVHYEDEDGDHRRLKKAQEYVKVDGVGTECGWGRADPNRISGLLSAHANILSNT
ncbi:MAG: hypothetical protein CMM29_06175 [Rhodospirillaceae bacterium]|nr:hypothetical protein [Rhodospirillaceae bacterium]|tara:strand:- start:1725 stop:2774 length:1050 start_codon:yes stop_codon:yes gene_type:complete